MFLINTCHHLLIVRIKYCFVRMKLLHWWSVKVMAQLTLAMEKRDFAQLTNQNIADVFMTTLTWWRDFQLIMTCSLGSLKDLIIGIFWTKITKCIIQWLRPCLPQLSGNNFGSEFPKNWNVRQTQKKDGIFHKTFYNIYH